MLNVFRELPSGNSIISSSHFMMVFFFIDTYVSVPQFHRLHRITKSIVLFSTSGDEQSLHADEALSKSGDPAWPDWVNGHVAPFGFRKLLKYIKDNYNDPTIIVTENGVAPPGEASKIGQDRLNDVFRVDYHKR